MKYVVNVLELIQEMNIYVMIIIITYHLSLCINQVPN